MKVALLALIAAAILTFAGMVEIAIQPKSGRDVRAYGVMDSP